MAIKGESSPPQTSITAGAGARKGKRRSVPSPTLPPFPELPSLGIPSLIHLCIPYLPKENEKHQKLRVPTASSRRPAQAGVKSVGGGRSNIKAQSNLSSQTFPILNDSALNQVVHRKKLSGVEPNFGFWPNKPFTTIQSTFHNQYSSS